MRSNILPLKKKEDKHISLSVVKLFFCCCCFFHSVVETLWVCDFVPAGGGWGLPSVPSFCAMLLHSDSCTTWAVAGGRLKSWKSWWCFKSSHIMSVHRNSRKRWGKKKNNKRTYLWIICEPKPIVSTVLRSAVTYRTCHENCVSSLPPLFLHHDDDALFKPVLKLCDVFLMALSSSVCAVGAGPVVCWCHQPDKMLFIVCACVCVCVYFHTVKGEFRWKSTMLFDLQVISKNKRRERNAKMSVCQSIWTVDWI